MDPLSIASGAAGLLSLTFQAVGLINRYVRNASSAPSDIAQLQDRLQALLRVLRLLGDFLASEDAESLEFATDSALEHVRKSCEAILQDLVRRLAQKSAGGNDEGASASGEARDKKFAMMRRLTWPFKKGEIQESCSRLHDAVQTFNFCLTLEQCKLMAKSSREVIDELRHQGEALEMTAQMLPQMREQLSENIARIRDVQAAVACSITELEVISAGVDVIQKAVDRKHLEDVLQWISPSENNPIKKHEATSSVRTKGTCNHLLEDDTIRDWIAGSSQSQYLCCLGNPGAGKSVFWYVNGAPSQQEFSLHRLASLLTPVLSSSAVIDHLQCMDGGAPVCYFYFEHQFRAEQTVLSIVRIILKHLLSAMERIPSDLEALYRKNLSRGRGLSLEEATATLQTACADVQKLYVCFDALDESGCLVDLFRIMGKMPETVHIFTTSRHGTEDMSKQFFETPVFMNMEAYTDDIRLFLVQMIEQDTRENPGLMDAAFQDTIIEELVVSSDGLFLKPKLHISNILAETTKRKRKNALSKPPKDLAEVYDLTLQRIKDQQRTKADQAMEVLAWVYLAETPLTLIQLRHALATEIDDDEFDEDNLPAQTFISACQGLAAVDPETNIVQLVHLSLNEYLTSTKVLDDFQGVLTDKCLAYLLFYIPYTSELSDRTLRISWLNQERPLLDYVICHWGNHVKKLGPLDDARKSRIFSYIQLNAISLKTRLDMLFTLPRVRGQFRREGLSWEWLQCVSPRAHILAYFGLGEIWLEMQEKSLGSLDIHADDGYRLVHMDQTSPAVPCPTESRGMMYYAVLNNHLSMVKLILSRHADGEPDTPCTCGEWIGLAARLGYQHIVDAFLRCPYVRLPAVSLFLQDLISPLSPTLVSILRHPLFDRESADEVLCRAAIAGLYEVVRTILDMGCGNVNAKHEGVTILSHAAGKGLLLIVELLLRHEAIDVNLADADYLKRTPLIHAIRNNHTEIARHILAREGVDVNAVDCRGNTALFTAAEHGFLAAVDLLLKHEDIRIDQCNHLDMTPLQKAMARGHGEVVQRIRFELQSRIANGSIKEPQISVPTAQAANWRTLGSTPNFELKMPALMQAYQEEIATRDGRGNAPGVQLASWLGLPFTDGLGSVGQPDDRLPLLLHEAVKQGAHGTLAQLLAQPELNVNILDEKGNPAITYAILRGDERAVIMLMGRQDTDLDEKNMQLMSLLMDWKNTPLDHDTAAEIHEFDEASTDQPSPNFWGGC